MQVPNPRSVLVVDDSAEILASTSAFLIQRGFLVHTSDSPLGVSSLVLRHRPSAIVLDVMMPALDGGALAKLLRSIPSAQATPVIFYSSMEEEQLYRLTKESDNATYVLKSDGLVALHAAICRRVGMIRG